jgi:hypothetical protein
LSGFAISTTAKPTAEFARSAVTSTCSTLNHWRAIAAPMSGLLIGRNDFDVLAGDQPAELFGCHSRCFY